MMNQNGIMVLPKSQKRLRESGEIISERTVDKYMKQMGIEVQWVKPWTIITYKRFVDARQQAVS